MSVRVHELKVWPRFFGAILDGSKTFELRRNDRDFQVGDELHLREWSPNAINPEKSLGQLGPRERGWWTGREVKRRVSYVLNASEAATLTRVPKADEPGAFVHGPLPLHGGWVVLGLQEVARASAARRGAFGLAEGLRREDFEQLSAAMDEVERRDGVDGGGIVQPAESIGRVTYFTVVDAQGRAWPNCWIPDHGTVEEQSERLRSNWDAMHGFDYGQRAVGVYRQPEGPRR